MPMRLSIRKSFPSPLAQKASSRIRGTHLADPRIGSIIQPSSLKGNGKARDEFGDLSIGPGGVVPPIGPYGTNKALDFGDIPVGSHSYRTIGELNNTGGLSMTVNIKYRAPTSSPFVVSDTGGHAAIHSASIAAQSSLFFVITFSPANPDTSAMRSFSSVQ